MKKYVRVKPTIVEAIQCFNTPECIARIEEIIGTSVSVDNKYKCFKFPTYPITFRNADGCSFVLLSFGDYLLYDEEFYFDTMTKDEFEKEFKEVEE